jgi:hypothetical protein
MVWRTRGQEGSAAFPARPRGVGGCSTALGLGRAADRSVPQNALKRLRERQILIQTDTGVYRYEDETFKDWVLTERPDNNSV